MIKSISRIISLILILTLTPLAAQATPLSGIVSLTDVGSGGISGQNFIGEGGFSDTKAMNLATGDVNNDGHRDILISEYLIDTTSNDAGKAYLFYGNGHSTTPITNFDPASADVVFEGVSTNENMGDGLALIDIDNDGYDDILIGSPRSSIGGVLRGGSLFIIDGSQVSNGTYEPENDISSTLAGGYFYGSGVNDLIAQDVANAGDINGDGIDDLIFSGRSTDSGALSNNGAAFIVYGDANFFSSLTASHSIANIGCTGAGCFSGARINGEFSGGGIDIVSAAGDIDNDGYADFLMSSPRIDYNSKTNSGGSYLIYGEASSLSGDFDVDDIYNGLAAVDGARFTINKSLSRLGSGTSFAGDQNQDGIDDFAIGIPGLDNNIDIFSVIDEAGAVYFFQGSDNNRYSGTIVVPTPQVTGSGLSPMKMLYGGYDEGHFGDNLDYAGDVNGDGFEDVIVGGADDTSLSGQPHLLYGPIDNFNNLHGLCIADCVGLNDLGDRIPGVIFQGDANEMAGLAVSYAGDFNEDGWDDLIIAKPARLNQVTDPQVDLVFGVADYDLPTGLVHHANYIVSPVSGTYSRNGIGSPSVTYDPYNDQYVMAFKSLLDPADYPAGSFTDCPVGVWGIGLATSSDGLSWTVQSTPLLLPADGEHYECVLAHPSIMYDGSKWRLWFKAEQGTDACAVTTPSWGCHQYTGVGYAELNNADLNSGSWTLNSTPVINRPTNATHLGYPDVIRHDEDGETWYTMFVEFQTEIFTFTSDDGLVWSQNDPFETIRYGNMPWVQDWNANDTEFYNIASSCQDSGSRQTVVAVGAREIVTWPTIDDIRMGFVSSSGDFSHFDSVTSSLITGQSGDVPYRHFDILNIGDGHFLVYYTEKDTTDGNKVKVKVASTDSTWNGTTVTWGSSDIIPKICPSPAAYNALLP